MHILQKCKRNKDNGKFLEYTHWEQNNTVNILKGQKATRKTPVPEKNKQRVYTRKAQPGNKGTQGKIRIRTTGKYEKGNTPKGTKRSEQLPNGENK